MSAHAKNRTHEDKLRHLERAVRKFGDSDGKRTEALQRLQGASTRRTNNGGAQREGD